MDVANISEVVTDCVFNHIFKTEEHSVQRVRSVHKCIIYYIFNVLQNYMLDRLVKLLLSSTNKSATILTFINLTLLQRYVKLNLKDFKDLFKWSLWPEVLRIFGM